MIGISTSAFSNLPGEEIVDKFGSFGFTQIELNFALTPRQVGDIIRAANRQGLYFSSLHNFVPQPPETERGIMLSDIDQTLRNRAVQLTKDTIMMASDIGATAVVLHIGQPRDWEFEKLQKQLREAIKAQVDPDIIEIVRQQIYDERKALPTSYFDSMLRSLDEILPLADNLNIGLGLENRYFYGQFPNFEELGILLLEFSGSKLGYWHDCGHAHHTNYCGLGTETESINAFKNSLNGVHLHDASFWSDHKLPGPEHDIDFRYLKPYINSDTILNLEPGLGVDITLLPSAIKYLKAAGIN
jgi:sugar phosphate isomerase/epimerase